MPDNAIAVAQGTGQERKAMKRSQSDSFSSNDSTFHEENDNSEYTSPSKKPKYHSFLKFAARSHKSKNPNLRIDVDLANFKFSSENRLIRPKNARELLLNENSILDKDVVTAMDVQHGCGHSTPDKISPDLPSYEAKPQEVFSNSKAPSIGESTFPIAELGSEGLLTMGHDFRSLTLLQFADCPHLIELVAQRARNYAEDNVSDLAVMKFDRVWREFWVSIMTREMLVHLDNMPYSTYRWLIDDSLQEFRNTTKLPKVRKFV